MNSMTVKNQVHKCKTLTSSPLEAHFCACCGIYMSQSKSSCVSFRPEKYRVMDPFRLDANLLLQEMVKKQNINRIYVSSAQFVKYRSELLRFLKYLRTRLEYSLRTYYLAVSILDCFLSQYKVENDNLKIFCFMALHMAAKMEENGPKVPELSVIAKLFENKYDVEDIENWEIAITKALNYSLNIRTPYTFVEHFLSKGVVNSMDLNCRSEAQAESQISNFEKVVMDLLDLTSSHYDFNNFSPMSVACAVIACARKSIGIKNTWTNDLECLTTQKVKDIEQCAVALSQVMGDSESSMQIEQTRVKNGASAKVSYNVHDKTAKKMTADLSDAKLGRKNSETMIIDTDEEEPVKNVTIYNSQRMA